MRLGLVRGDVELHDHEMAWEENAKQTITYIKKLLGDIVVDIQHIGSTAISNIKAKPIIDIVVGVSTIEKIKTLLNELASAGVVHRPNNDLPEYMMFIMGDLDREIRTHHIHIVPFNSEEWNNQLNFRDYMNAHGDKAKEYKVLKLNLMNQYHDNRTMYTSSKDSYIKNIFIFAVEWKQLTAV